RGLLHDVCHVLSVALGTHCRRSFTNRSRLCMLAAAALLERPMKLVVKFTFVFVIVFGIGFVFAAYMAHGFLQKNATDEVIENAHLMMETALSMRDYTTKQIKPLLIGDHATF